MPFELVAAWYANRLWCCVVTVCAQAVLSLQLCLEVTRCIGTLHIVPSV
jgi:hypothetical protein